jgi:hypothetical protein
MRKWIFVAHVTLLTAACGKAPVSGPDMQAVQPQPSAQLSSADGTDPTPSAPPPGSATVVPPPPSPGLIGGPAIWSALANTLTWTKAVHMVVARDLAKFEKARDRELFCPGYAQANLAQRETCWVRLVSAVTQLESNFDPNSMYFESFGVWSVGLMQLSKNECSNAPTIASLKDPVQNLICGTDKMATLIARYGYVTTPDGTHGAAAYWSTLRGSRKLQVARMAAQYLQINPAGPGWKRESLMLAGYPD